MEELFRQYADLVRQMREAQEEHLNTRTNSIDVACALWEAREAAEKAVDTFPLPWERKEEVTK